MRNCVVDRWSLCGGFAQSGRPSICTLHNFCPWNVWIKWKLSFQTISNKHNCCSNNNNNTICDNQITSVQEKDKEVLMVEKDENYQKFRQLLDYEDVRRPLLLISGRGLIHVYSPGSQLSSVQSLHPQRLSNDAAVEALHGIDILVDKRNCKSLKSMNLWKDFALTAGWIRRSTYGRTYSDCFCSSHFL